MSHDLEAVQVKETFPAKALCGNPTAAIPPCSKKQGLWKLSLLRRKRLAFSRNTRKTHFLAMCLSANILHRAHFITCLTHHFLFSEQYVHVLCVCVLTGIFKNFKNVKWFHTHCTKIILSIPQIFLKIWKHLATVEWGEWAPVKCVPNATSRN